MFQIPTLVTATVQRHQVVAFYLLAYTRTWLVWGTSVAQQHGLLTFHIPDWFGYWGVTIAAFAVAGVVDGSRACATCCAASSAGGWARGGTPRRCSCS